MNDLIPRYLTPFHPKHLPHYFTDVLIIGGGLAGLRAANAVGDGVTQQINMILHEDRRSR